MPDRKQQQDLSRLLRREEEALRRLFQPSTRTSHPLANIDVAVKRPSKADHATGFAAGEPPFDPLEEF